MTQRDKKILVLGTTGKQGGVVARHLLDRGFTDVHAFVRTADGTHAKLLTDKGITLEIGDLDNSTSIDAAMKDAYGVFSVLPLDQRGPETEIRRGRTVAEAAKRANVQHFIYSSVGGADQSEGVTHFQTKHVIEQNVRELGLPASIVRPAPFMENFMTFEHPQAVDGAAVFRVAIHPETKRQMTTVDDIGMVVADMFARPEESIGKTLELAGDEPPAPQIADLYTKVTGQPARFEEQPIEEVQAFNPDFAAMFTWLNTHDSLANIATLRADYPALTTFEVWLSLHSSAVVAQ